MSEHIPLGGSIVSFLRERRQWLAGADLRSLIPGILRLNKASIHTALSELEQAERELEHVRSAGSSSPGLELGYLYHACNLYYQFSLWEKMDPVRERLLSLARQVDFRPDIARGLHFTGLETINSGDYRQAVGYFMQALDIEQDLTDAALLGEIYNDIGFCYRRIGDTAKAEEHYLASLMIREQSGNLLGQAESLSNLGFLKIFQGQPRQAEALLAKAYQLETQIGDRLGAGYTLVNLGYLAYQRGEFTKSRDYHQRALDIRIKLNDPLGQGHCYLQLRALSDVDDDSASELRLLNAAYQAFVRANDTTGRIETVISFAEYWIELGKVDVAEKIRRHLSPRLRDLSVKEIQRRYLGLQISLALQDKDRDTMERYWDTFIQLVPDFESTTTGLLQAAAIAENLGRMELAIKHWRSIRSLASQQSLPFDGAKALWHLGQHDDRQGRAMAEQALNEFRRMGAKRLARKAACYLATLDQGEL